MYWVVSIVIYEQNFSKPQSVSLILLPPKPTAFLLTLVLGDGCAPWGISSGIVKAKKNL